jgi:hypothetical protein
MLGRTIRRATAVALAAGALWAPSASAQSGGPVLVVTGADRFGDYYAEILRAEGLNEFAVANVGSLSPALLSGYQVVVLAPTGVTPDQVAALTGWVNAGGNLIAMRPGNELAPLLGLGPDGGDVAEGYMAIDTSSAPGAGITGGTMQFHGTADARALAGARQVAALYSNASAPAGAPAVTLRGVGSAGGQAAAFTYDLARSVVYTRQGNPAWAGLERDGQPGPIRSNDLFFGGSSPDYVDLNKVAIPQADEQQRLLANLIIQMNLDRTPLPRFWYLPRGGNAAVVMTGDDHAVNNNEGRTREHFNSFKSASPAGCSWVDWQCVRATSYVMPSTSVPGYAGYRAEGFEVALHLDTGCGDFTWASINGNWNDQLQPFKNAFGQVAPRTNRTHCIAWSDWASEAKAARANGVRLDTNYYYWPGSWTGDRPGMFTGSGFPQRFADTDGSLIDVYQATTQLVDEWGDSGGSDSWIATHSQALIAKANGPEGFYGVFTANMHTDRPVANANTIVAVAQHNGAPVVSAEQMLDWIDGRSGSSFRNLSYTNQRLRFTVAGGARGLQGMVPAATAGGPLSSLTRNGVPVVAPARAVKGMTYAFFDAAAGDYVATYGDPVPDTAITGVSVSGTTARLSFVSDSPGATFQCRLDGGGFTACGSPREYRGLSNGTHTFHVRSIDASGKVDPTPAERRFTVGKLVLKGPKVKITPKRVRITKDGTVRLRVRCPASESKCRVKLKLRAKRKTVAARTFLVKGGKSRVIELTLTRSTRASLARKRTLRLTAVAVSRNAGRRAVTRKTIQLVAR